MQVRGIQSNMRLAQGARPTVRLELSPHPPGYLLAGLGLGIVLGFALGSVATLLVGPKSLLLAQHLWHRLTGDTGEGDHVHFELLLQ